MEHAVSSLVDGCDERGRSRRGSGCGERGRSQVVNGSDVQGKV